MDFDEACDDIDRIIETDEVNERIEQFRRRSEALRVGEDGRAEYLTSLASELQLIGDLDGARTTYEWAIADGGRTVLEPRCGLLGVEIEAGQEDRVTEMLKDFLLRARAGDLTITECEWIGDTLEDAKRYREAHRWFTIPLRDIDPLDIDDLPRGALHGRWRVRRELELPNDAYDDAAQLLQRTGAGLGEPPTP
ncbi:hypothetical protein [Aeromicrobium sp. CF3.5]|uniref:hypothetical protein n=1 Tax=Aeromicrobium sp. CF3.5 TaxID=3373078 RepID=UPI003EE4DDD0